MIGAPAARILVITQEPTLLTSVRMILEQEEHWQISGFLWSQSPSLLRPETLQQSDLVVAELYRKYEYGIRAEAVVLAERCAGHPPFLIIAPRYCSHEINCPGYWDVAAKDTLKDRVTSLLQTPASARLHFERLKSAFAHHLAIPKQH